ncbi:MAG TPA: hypothetical protein PKM41_06495 [Deltaproteobacteria bacterium]|jgi:cytochrome c5|nr:hypothetical protein [Deltaproteobacteria bacterium]HOI06758.1 hypothetical protein [Deltaproteobacteria bacterium]
MVKLSWLVPVTVGGLIVLAAGVASCARPQAQQSGSPSEIVMSACTACHDARKVCDNIGKKDRKAWQATVTRMVDKGADVSKENIPVIAEYLASLEPGSAPVCP